MPPIPLSRAYPSRDGAPVLTHVDPAIFRRTYFGACMACGFCHDACCTHGVDVEEPRVAAILGHADALEPIVGTPRAGWFTPVAEPDPEFPGGAYRRTAVVEGACVFKNRRGRGCLLHAYCLETGRDYHTLKPLVSTLFPLSVAHGTLLLADELDDPTQPLVCGGAGPTVYTVQRSELAYYFGDALVLELDGLAESAAREAR